jgi:hypothetical protein
MKRQRYLVLLMLRVFRMVLFGFVLIKVEPVSVP